MATNLDPLARLERAAPDDTGAAAKALEAYFLRQVLAEVRSATGSADGGFAGATFHEMLDEALADAMASAGGVGLADVVEGSMGSATVSDPRAPAALPVPGAPSSPFGRRADPIDGDARFHAGVDLRAAEGTPVHATSPGRVRFAGPAGGYGNLVIIDHGEHDGGVESRYAHLASVAVRPGQRVAAGETVGAVGMTGRATGPHLHFEVRDGGRPVDPLGTRSPLKLSTGGSKPGSGG
jgi:murein DD-endopeptidase MepM/ murein hydrolase activator NlpD